MELKATACSSSQDGRPRAYHGLAVSQLKLTRNSVQSEVLYFVSDEHRLQLVVSLFKGFTYVS
jgi:hypothetical protein